MAKFLTELKRRHIYRVGAAYAVVAWVVLQIVNNVAPGLNLPNWAVSLVIVLLSVGFPFALVFAWVLPSLRRCLQRLIAAPVWPKFLPRWDVTTKPPMLCGRFLREFIFLER